MNRAPGAPIVNNRDYRDPKNKENSGAGRPGMSQGSIFAPLIAVRMGYELVV